MIYCRNCGTHFKEKGRFCPGCGSSLLLQDKQSAGRFLKKGKSDISQGTVQQTAPTSEKKTPLLVGINGCYAGKAVELKHGPVIIGRDPRTAHIVYSTDKIDISRRHCTVRYEPGNEHFIIENLSKHGTYLSSGERLTAGNPVCVESGTRFLLGDPAGRGSVEQFEVRLC